MRYPCPFNVNFLVEVASTCNEALLMEYLLQHTENTTTRKYLINYFLEQFRGTLFRQTMFAEFEKITHEMAERGEPLTWEVMNRIYHDLNVEYFGEDGSYRFSNSSKRLSKTFMAF